jgi:hypothetical protein
VAEDSKTERDDEVEAHQFPEQAELRQSELRQAELRQGELKREDDGPDVEGHRQIESQFEGQLED